MVSKYLILISVIGLSACSFNNIKGLGNEARNYRTPSPAQTQYFPTQPAFPSWTDADEGYRFYPGDEIEINVLGAPELSKTVIVAPDGRIAPNLIGNIMIADRNAYELQAMLEGAYSAQLRNPKISIAPKAFASQKIFIGGEVAKPGIYDLPGEIDPLQAITIAGGFLNSAKRDDLVVLRRGAGGQPFMRTYNMRTILSDPNYYAALPRLRRFDVIWVPKSKIAEAGLFTQQFIRDALPVTIGFNYSIGGRTY